MKKKFLLRISPELWDELNRWADQEFRSVNSQIEFLLREAVLRRNRNARMDLPDGDLDKGDVS
ncbi:MAG: Arc family DNA binding domain-containing protein [Candidatus Omnitrophica bacterium]|nr:MAG: hypothetical protein UZ16_OP3001001493 [Candidatus Hinthialibacteria bacterium OLB16]MBE7488896.1 Arc family DNA binding domain-containing protein [bacterium]MBK7496559.1 Arc family DNA binding domain-containing protein [Candidatus Omnitrophota bacterium]MCC6734389.1 Arc family DNA binding domain-containing protein [Candidatus Omnitrophota bacterium]MCL4733644.1 Arc family DNA binding domain-containing protein [Candidatus Omnitrophota bacterium]